MITSDSQEEEPPKEEDGEEEEEEEPADEDEEEAEEEKKKYILNWNSNQNLLASASRIKEIPLLEKAESVHNEDDTSEFGR